MRALVPAEVAAVVLLSVVGLPIPAVVPLLVVASASLWLRGRSWAEVTKGPALYALIGGAAGIVALVLALWIGTPIAESLTDYAVQWSSYPIVRGSSVQFFVVALVVALFAVAAELVVRGWIVERVLELGGHPLLAVLVGAFAEALLAPGDFTVRIGAGLVGIGLGWMYVAAGRSVVAPICARVAFTIGALLLEAMRLVG